MCFGKAYQNTVWGSGIGGMQELFKDSCKQVGKTTQVHYDGLGTAIINIFVFQGRDLGVSFRGARKDVGPHLKSASN